MVALGELIPRIGPWLARIPLLVFAAFEGWVTFGLVALASVLIENAKGFVISPLVEGNQLDVHPLLILIAVLTGSTLFGAGGAFVAVPAAAIVQVFFNEVIVPWRNEQIEEDQARQALERGEPPGG